MTPTGLSTRFRVVWLVDSTSCTQCPAANARLHPCTDDEPHQSLWRSWLDGAPWMAQKPAMQEGLADLLAVWAKAWAISRQAPPPEPYRGGWRTEVGKPEQLRRY